jgi:hypothetical protein
MKRIEGQPNVIKVTRNEFPKSPLYVTAGSTVDIKSNCSIGPKRFIAEVEAYEKPNDKGEVGNVTLYLHEARRVTFNKEGHMFVRLAIQEERKKDLRQPIKPGEPVEILARKFEAFNEEDEKKNKSFFRKIFH